MRYFIVVAAFFLLVPSVKSQDTIRAKELLFFSNDGCGKCETTLLYFQNHQMPFTKLAVKENRTLMYEYVHKKTGGKNTPVGYPVLVYGDSIYFSIKNLNAKLAEIELMMKADGLIKDEPNQP